MLVWHYTYREPTHFDCILADGVLKLEGEVSGYPEAARKLIIVPGVWFSTDETFDVTAIKPVWKNGRQHRQTLQESLPRAARFGIDSAGLLTWPDYKMRAPVIANLSRRRRDEAASLFASMEKIGTWKDWYVSLDRVPQDRWLSIQVWESGWVDFQPTAAK